MKDISVVIAHRGDPIGLWATTVSVNQALKNSPYSYEFCLCLNGEAERRIKEQTRHLVVSPDTQQVLRFLGEDGTLGYLRILQRDVAPPTARQIASERAQGKYLFFLDAHCIVEPDYFKVAIDEFERSDVDLLHSTTRFYDGERVAYHYNLKLDKDFWADSACEPLDPNNAYAVASGGHGGFAVDSRVWRATGGYFDGFEGYGGEELTTDLRLWMLGYNVALHPKMVHYHWSGKRGYARHFTPDYYRNMMMSAHIIGGEKSLYKVYEHFSTHYPELVRAPFHDLLVEAYFKSKDYRDRLRSIAARTLDEQLEYFRYFGIPH